MSLIGDPPGTLSRAESVLAALDDEQRAAAQAVTGPVCILAGAGTGKTRTITHRIAYGVRTGVYVPEQVLAVTFTARAAGELRGRLAGLEVGGGAGAHVPRRRAAPAALLLARRSSAARCPSLVENKLRLVATAAARARLSTDRTSLRDLASEIEWAKTTLATPDDYPARAAAAGREPPFEAAAVAAVFASYESAKQRDGAARLRGPAAGHRLRARGAPRGRPARSAAQYRHFVVDEYQDVNPLQQRLLDAWLGGRAELCVVGDPNQTIYSFTGADPDYLLGFADRYPDAAVVKLERDYRSTPQVVGAGQPADRPGAPAQGPARACGCWASAPTVPSRRSSSTPTSRPRPPPSPRALPGADRRAARRPPRSRCCSGSTPSPRSTRRRSPTSASRTCSRAASGSSSGRRSARRCCCCAARPRAAASRARWCPTVRDVLASTGWVEHRPPPGGAARDRWQSLAALVDLAVDLVAESPTARPGRLRRDLAAARRRPARPDRRRASRWRRCTRPRAWSGTPSSSSAWSTASCRSPSRCPARRRWRRSAGCSTSASPAPASS